MTVSSASTPFQSFINGTFVQPFAHFTSSSLSMSGRFKIIVLTVGLSYLAAKVAKKIADSLEIRKKIADSLQISTFAISATYIFKKFNMQPLQSLLTPVQQEEFWSLIKTLFENIAADIKNIF